MESIEVVFQHFSQLDGFRAERLGDAMRVLGMSPTEDQDWHGCDVLGRFLELWIHFDPQVRKHLEDLGGPQYIDEGRFTISSRTQGLGRVPWLAVW